MENIKIDIPLSNGKIKCPSKPNEWCTNVIFLTSCRIWLVIPDLLAYNKDLGI